MITHTWNSIEIKTKIAEKIEESCHYLQKIRSINFFRKLPVLKSEQIAENVKSTSSSSIFERVKREKKERKREIERERVDSGGRGSGGFKGHHGKARVALLFKCVWGNAIPMLVGDLA